MQLNRFQLPFNALEMKSDCGDRFLLVRRLGQPLDCCYTDLQSSPDVVGY